MKSILLFILLFFQICLPRSLYSGQSEDRSHSPGLHKVENSPDKDRGFHFTLRGDPRRERAENHDARNPASKKNPFGDIEELIAGFSLSPKASNRFFLLASLNPLPHAAPAKKKNPLLPLLEATKINLVVWAFDKYILGGSWANLSWASLVENFKRGYAWDYDDFGTNHFGHAYHGAMYHSAARYEGMGFFESILVTAFGSFTWEFMWESERPGRNDSIITTLGGMNLGEVLFKMANLVPPGSAPGRAGMLQKILRFLVNPVAGVSPAKARPYASQTHRYSLGFPLGAAYTSDGLSTVKIGVRLEYEDAFRDPNSKPNPYDWFSFDARVGVDRRGLRDPEITSWGFILGKKVNKGLMGLFGVFDYMATHTAKKMTVAGLGPGFASPPGAGTGLSFGGSGVLSFI